MFFSVKYDKKVFLYSILGTIMIGTFPLVSTLMNSELFFRVIPYLIGIIAICLSIGIANQLWIKSGYLIALSWIFNPIIWFLYGAGSIWYIRVIGVDWFWWLVYPGIYLLFFIIQIIFAKWWQSHDALIVKISIWVMIITPLLTGGRYGRYSIRYVGSQTIQVLNNPIQIVDLTMLLLFTIGGLGMILFSGRNLWQRVGEYEEEKRQLIENKL